MRWGNRLVDRLGHCRRAKDGGGDQSVFARGAVDEGGGEMTKKEAQAYRRRWQLVAEAQQDEH